jgi:hypothetical protein
LFVINYKLNFGNFTSFPKTLYQFLCLLFGR